MTDRQHLEVLNCGGGRQSSALVLMACDVNYCCPREGHDRPALVSELLAFSRWYNRQTAETKALIAAVDRGMNHNWPAIGG